MDVNIIMDATCHPIIQWFPAVLSYILCCFGIVDGILAEKPEAQTGTFYLQRCYLISPLSILVPALLMVMHTVFALLLERTSVIWMDKCNTLHLLLMLTQYFKSEFCTAEAVLHTDCQHSCFQPEIFCAHIFTAACKINTSCCMTFSTRS